MLLVHVAQQSPQHFWDTLAAIMDVRDDGPQMSHQELADVVAAVGVAGDLVAVQRDADLRAQVRSFSDEASSLEVRHVPWINIDGKSWDRNAENAGSLLDAAHATLG